MIYTPDNSFFHHQYKRLPVMVIVPHEDDEINIAASLILSLVRGGADLSLVFVTNGDWKYKADIRVKEAIASAKVLGVPESKTFFLGFGDSIANDEHTHLFYHEKDIARSPAGFEATYGTETVPEYYFKRHGEHLDYTASNYLKNLIEIIEDLRPEMIVSTDFDEHPDHRMLSLQLDRAIGIIKKKHIEYNPEIWKSFAYALAYTAVPDFTAKNNPETKRPIAGETEKYSEDLVGSFNNSWENRVRIPVPYDTQADYLKKSIITHALQSHKSQNIVSRANRIINSDEVFWTRRTDSLTYTANVSTSSGDVSLLTDFMLYDVDDIDRDKLSLTKHYWHPAEDDEQKKILFQWPRAVSIEQVVLYGARSADSSVDALQIRLDDGYDKVICGLPKSGNPAYIDLGHHEGIHSCEISILSYSGDQYGIAECEIFSSQNAVGKIAPFCKITINDNFIYHYYYDKDIARIPIGLYKYGLTEPIDIQVVKGKSIIISGELIVDPEDESIIICASTCNKKVFDRVVLTRMNNSLVRRFSSVDSRNARFIRSKKRQQKLHNMVYMLRNRGLRFVINRIFNNSIRLKLRGKNEFK